MKNKPIILDTHIWIWLLEGNKRLSQKEVQIIEESASSGSLLISAISVWEVGMLLKKEKIVFSIPCEQWIKEALGLPGIFLAPLSPEIAIDSSFLPGEFHGDPADRIIVSTARVLNAKLITHDEKVIEYGKQGCVNVL